MPALSFKPEWVDDLLACRKLQTTRKPALPGKPPRIKEGDLCNVYISQRGRILDKPIRSMTPSGHEVMMRLSEDSTKSYPPPGQETLQYFAHFIGKIEVTEVYEFCPAEMSTAALEGWAALDGFEDFDRGDMWFVRHYGDGWIDQQWSAIRWDAWAVRYFEESQ